MKIITISDSHDNIPNIDKMLAYTKKNGIKVMLHCGDVCTPGTLKYIADKFNGDIYHVCGNVDSDNEMIEEFSGIYKRWHLLGEIGNPTIKGVEKKIGMTHYPTQAKEMAKSGKYDIIFYGHDHRPWEEKIDNTKILNPGTLAGLFQKATFAIWDTETDKFKLKIVDTL